MIVKDYYIEKFDSILEERVNNTLTSIKNKKQRFRVSRVPEDMRNVPIILDVQFGSLLLRDSFDWNLNDWNISPKEFINQFCSRLKISDQHDRLYRQLIFQLMDYIERHQFQDPQKTSEFQKPSKKKQLLVPKPTARQQRIQQRVANKKCINCEFSNNSPGIDCRKCLVPFHVTDNLNKQDPIQEACLIFFEVVARTKMNYILSKEFKAEDFKSLYTIKEKLLKQVHNSIEEKGVEQAFSDLMRLKNVAQYKLEMLPDEIINNNNQNTNQEEIEEEEEKQKDVKKETEEDENKEEDKILEDEEQQPDSKSESKKSIKSQKSNNSKKIQDDEEEQEEQQNEEEEDDQAQQKEEEVEDEEDNENEEEEELEKPINRRRDRNTALKPRRSVRAIEKRLKKQKAQSRQKYRY